MKEVRAESQVKNLEARTEAEAMEKWGSPACSLSFPPQHVTVIKM